MTPLVAALLISLASPAQAPPGAQAPAPVQPAAAPTGTFTNEEQVYFEGEAKRAPPPWTGIRIDPDGQTGLVWQTIDRFGAVLASQTVMVTPDQWRIGDCALAISGATGGPLTFSPTSGSCAGRAVPVRMDVTGMTLRLPDGRETLLLRARPFVCWLSVLRTEPKADGGEDWLFQAGMITHDQGGRLRLGGGNSGAPEATIRIRNVVWPPPTRNRPSLVLYVFAADDMTRAVAYGWADPGAVRVGINQRWMQASCTLQGAE